MWEERKEKSCSWQIKQKVIRRNYNLLTSNYLINIKKVIKLSKTPKPSELDQINLLANSNSLLLILSKTFLTYNMQFSLKFPGYCYS